MKISKVVNTEDLQTGPAGRVILGEMSRMIELDKVGGIRFDAVMHFPPSLK